MDPPFKYRNSKGYSSVAYGHRIFKQLAKALIRVCVCAGWSEPFQIAQPTLLEISCCGAYMDLLFALERNALTSCN